MENRFSFTLADIFRYYLIQAQTESPKERIDSL